MARKKRILAVDDSLTVRKLVGLVLGNEGYEVHLAETGQQGLQAVTDFAPDLILLDYILPDLPSPEICQRLLTGKQSQDIPILMISSNGKAIRELYQDSPNVKDYLTKPFQPKVLTSVVKHLIEKAERAREEARLAAATGPALPDVPAPVAEAPAPVAPLVEEPAPVAPVAEPVVEAPVAEVVVVVPQPPPPPPVVTKSVTPPPMPVPRPTGGTTPPMPVARPASSTPAPFAVPPVAPAPAVVPPPAPVVPPTAAVAPAAPVAARQAPPPIARPPAPAAAAAAPVQHATDDTSVKMRALLAARLRTIAKHLPTLEQRRAGQPPEAFYLPYLVRPELVADVVAEMGKIKGGRSEAPVLAAPVDFVGFDLALQYLAKHKSRGALHFEVQGEALDFLVDDGRVVAVHSNNPRAYCQGAPYNFKAVPAAALQQAVTAQQRQGVPVFVGLHKAGVLPTGPMLQSLLRGQGERACTRALAAPAGKYAFVPQAHLPEVALQYALNLPIIEVLLNAYRATDDWLTIESTVQPLEAPLARTPLYDQLAREIHFLDREAGLLNAMDGVASAQSIISYSGLSHFEACQSLFALLRLGLIQFVSAPPPTPAELEGLGVDPSWLNE